MVEESKKPGLEWHPRWEEGSLMLLTDRVVLRKISYDLAVRSELRNIKGDGKRAIADFEAHARFAALTRQDPNFFPPYGRQDDYTLAAILACKIAFQNLHDSVTLKVLSEALRPLESGPDLQSALKGEAYFNIWQLRNLRKFGGWVRVFGSSDDFWNTVGERDIKGPFASEGDLSGIAAKAMAVKSFKFFTDINDILSSEKEWFTASPKISKVVLDASMDESLSGKHLSREVNYVNDVLSAAVYCRAQIVTTRAALLLMAKKVEGNGKLQIKDLAGEWLDPYTGKLLRSKWSGNVVKVWSVGEDGVDDGGMVRLPSGAGRPTDVAVELPYSPPKAAGTMGQAGGPP